MATDNDDSSNMTSPQDVPEEPSFIPNRDEPKPGPSSSGVSYKSVLDRLNDISERGDKFAQSQMQQHQARQQALFNQAIEATGHDESATIKGALGGILMMGLGTALTGLRGGQIGNQYGQDYENKLETWADMDRQRKAALLRQEAQAEGQQASAYKGLLDQSKNNRVLATALAGQEKQQHDITNEGLGERKVEATEAKTPSEIQKNVAQAGYYDRMPTNPADKSFATDELQAKREWDTRTRQIANPPRGSEIGRSMEQIKNIGAATRYMDTASRPEGAAVNWTPPTDESKEDLEKRLDKLNYQQVGESIAGISNVVARGGAGSDKRFEHMDYNTWGTLKSKYEQWGSGKPKPAGIGALLANTYDSLRGEGDRFKSYREDTIQRLLDYDRAKQYPWWEQSASNIEKREKIPSEKSVVPTTTSFNNMNNPVVRILKDKTTGKRFNQRQDGSTEEIK